MISNFSRFAALMALQVILGVFVVLLLAGDNAASPLMKLNAIGAKGKEVIKDGAGRMGDSLSAVGKKIANPIYPEVGAVDLESGTAAATGYGALPANAETFAQGQLLAVDAAQMDAERNLAATLAGFKLKSTRVSTQHTVEQYDIEQSVKAKVKGCRVVEVRYNPDGSVEVDVEIPLKTQGKG